MGAKSSLFSKTLISVSVRAFLLKLKTDFEQKYPFRRLASVTEYLISSNCSNSCSLFKSISLTLSDLYSELEL